MKGALRLAKKGLRKCLKLRARFCEDRRRDGDHTRKGSAIEPTDPPLSARNEGSYAAEPSKIIRLQSDSREYMAIVPNAEFLAEMRTAVLEHRKMTSVEEDFNEELEGWKAGYDQLELQIAEVAWQIAEAEAKTQQESQEEKFGGEAIDLMREEMQKLHRERQAVLDRRDASRTKMHAQYEDLRRKQFLFFHLLEELLVEDPNEAARQSDPSNSKLAPATPHALHGPEGEAQQFEDIGPTEQLHQSEDKKVKELFHLINGLARCVEQAEYDLDHRHETFARLQEERKRKAEFGDPVQSLPEFELFQVTETQRLTRALIDAEAQYQDAKQAAIDAGIQPPGSEIESGFVSDIDDGYRESEEREISETVDKARVYRWRVDTNASVDHRPREHPYDLASTELEFRAANISFHPRDWRPREVEMWESASMLAQGPARRRIDKWRDVVRSSSGLSRLRSIVASQE
ncbi:Hypothetical predicted protein [Lecanosticta acicola]|uniref:Uncharacterized protein n=1 Tax=Lecanosticta acicola TaxID=111012 RepID=A0AAI9E9L9_9PEZI|nr:Hypothetical predicted protein [Lecanosticta acicola]